MKRYAYFYMVVCLWIMPLVALAQALPKLFLILTHDQLVQQQKLLNNPYVSGAQIIYSWKLLEPKKNDYNFLPIYQDLKILKRMHKDLFVQLQDRSFEINIYPVPEYIREQPQYQGGVAEQVDFAGEGKPLGSGWVAQLWLPAVNHRFQQLILHLGKALDGKIYGINLPETALDVNLVSPPIGFTTQKYFLAEKKNMKILRQSFLHSQVIQYVNFFPGEWNNDHGYMGQLFEAAIKYRIGLGGPDVVPFRQGQMKNSYPFFHRYHGKLSAVGMAVQSGDYSYTNPVTHQKYTFKEFYQFAVHYLGATILFWNVDEPFFSQQLKPNLGGGYFQFASQGKKAN